MKTFFGAILIAILIMVYGIFGTDASNGAFWLMIGALMFFYVLVFGIFFLGYAMIVRFTSRQWQKGKERNKHEIYW